MKGSKKLIAKWILFIIPSLFMAIVGRILAPILPFFAKEDGRLPDWLWWFATPHSTLDGDKNHQARWKGTDKFHTWMRRTAWLLRNVAYGFDRKVLGITLPDDDFLFVQLGEKDTGDLSGVSGTSIRYVIYNGQVIDGE